MKAVPVHFAVQCDFYFMTKSKLFSGPFLLSVFIAVQIFKVVQSLECVDEILKGSNSNENDWTALSCGFQYNVSKQNLAFLILEQ